MKAGKAAAAPLRTGLGGGQVEGHHAVHELLMAGRRRAHNLWVAGPERLNRPLQDLAALARERGVAVQMKPPAVLARASRTDAPQGVIAWADDIEPVPLGELLAPRPAGGQAFLLVLDGVTDPGNFGSLLRSAACAGATGAVVGRHRSAPLTPGAVKAAAGAVEHLAFAQVAGVPAALLEMSRAGLWVVGLDPRGEQDIWSVAVLARPLALVLGSEGGGLSRLTRERCDVLARIPQVGPLESLNVAAAGAVACFEVARWRSRGDRADDGAPGRHMPERAFYKASPQPKRRQPL
ncbi:MAG: TrmH family RNA methyltransferase [Acidimicrobiales bacterium]